MDQYASSNLSSGFQETDYPRHILPRPPRRLLSAIRYSSRPHGSPSPFKSFIRTCIMSWCCRLDSSNDIMALAGSTNDTSTFLIRSRIPPPLGRFNCHRPIRNPDRNPLRSKSHCRHLLENTSPCPITRSSPRCYPRRQD
jgi:hypothetical protein